MNPKDDRVVNPVIAILEQPAAQARFLNTCQLNDLNKQDTIEVRCALKNLNFDLGALRLFVMASLVDKHESSGGGHLHTLRCRDNTVVTRSELFKSLNAQIAPNTFFFELDSATKECQVSGLFVVNSSTEELRESCARECLKRQVALTGVPVTAQLLDSLSAESERLVEEEMQSRLRFAASSANEAKVRLQVIIYNTLSNTLDSFLTEPVYTNPIVNLAFNRSEFFRDQGGGGGGSRLKIVRSSRIGGRMQGNDELFLFCSHAIDPGDIQVEFFQITEDAQISWRALGRLDRSDIHSNSALVVYTPEYPVRSLHPPQTGTVTDEKAAAPVEKVKVYYRLLKPSTREYSEKWVFYYFLKANDDFVNLFSSYFSEEKFLRRYRHFLENSAYEKTTAMVKASSRTSATTTRRAKRKKVSAEPKKSDTVEMKDIGDEGEIEAVSADSTDEDESESEETDTEQVELDSEMWADQGGDEAVPPVAAKPPKKSKSKLKSLEAVSAVDINSNSNSPDSSLAKTTANKLSISGSTSAAAASSSSSTTLDRTRFSLESLDTLDPKAVKENLANCITKMNGLAERSGKALLRFAKTRSLHELLKTQRFLLNHQDENGNTPIHLAIVYGNLDILEIFVDIAMTIPYQNLINLKNSKHLTPLLLAAHLNEPHVCEFLLDAKADITVVDANGCNIVHIACKNKNYELLKVALKHIDDKSSHYETIDSINHDGYSPLHVAVMNKSKEITRELLYIKNLKINMADRRTGMTALHHAAAFSDLLAICSLLVNNEAIEIDAKAYNGCTPLHVAVANKNYLIAALLIKHNANVYLQSDTPVHNDSELYHSAQRKYNTLRKVIEHHVQTTTAGGRPSAVTAEMEADSKPLAASNVVVPGDFNFPDAKVSEEVYRAYEQEAEREKSDEFSDARVRSIPSQHNYDAMFYAQNDPWMQAIFKSPSKLDKSLLRKILCYEKVKRLYAEKFGLNQTNTSTVIQDQIMSAARMINDLENNKTSNPVKMSSEEKPI